MKVWKRDALSEEFFTDARYEDMGRVRHVKFTQPESLRGQFPEGLRIVVESPRPPADYFKCGAMDVASEGLMRELAAHPGVKAEFFPVEVLTGKGGRVETQFYCMHVLDRADCFDFERSKFSVDEDGFIEDIDKLVLDESKALGHELFRVANVDFVILCASEPLAQRVSAGGFTGVKFFDPSELFW